MSPDQIGRYKVERLLGRGGMAVVYLGRDPYVKRQVAIKVLPVQFTDTPELRARFQREAEIIAALEHPAIVPIYDYGEHAGQPFIVMRYMPGGSLADRLHQGPLPVGEAATILQRLGGALDRAHAQGIIHRDLKPGNILFDQYGDAYLSDFGIARLAEATVSLTGGGVIGTPAYMSPEQVYGDRPLDGRSDIYALGVILFEMLTGEVPYQADTPAKLMLKHILEPVPRIRVVKPELPDDCEAMIEKALAKEPELRYPTATAMAQELITQASPTRPSAPPPPAPPPPVASLATPTEPTESLTAVMPPEVTAGAEEAKPDTVLATPAEMAAPAVAAAAAATPGEAGPQVSRRRSIPVWGWGWVVVGLFAFVLCGGASLLGSRLLMGGAAAVAEATREATAEEVAAALTEPSTEGGGVIAPTEEAVAGEEAADGAGQYEEGAWLGRGLVTQLAVSPDGNTIAAAGSVGIWLYDPATLEPYQLLVGHEGLVTSVSWSPDGSQLASGGYDNYVKIWDVASGQYVEAFDAHSLVYSVAWSPDGQYIAAGGYEGFAQVWSAADGLEVATLEGHEGPIRSVAWSPDSTWLASAGEDGSIRLWHPLSGEEIYSIQEHEGLVESIAWSLDGALLYSASDDDTVRVWDTVSGEEINEWQAHDYGLIGLALSPDGSQLATTGGDGLVQVWDVASGEALHTWADYSAPISVAWLSDSALVITFSDHAIRIWDVAAESEVLSSQEHTGQVTGLAWSPDGQFIASGHGDGLIRVWNATDHSVVSVLPLFGSARQGLAWSPEGQYLAGTYGGSVIVWDPFSGEEIISLGGLESYLNSVAWSPDSSLVAAAGWDDYVHVWHLDGGGEHLALEGTLGYTVAWSPNGEWLTTTNEENAIIVWDVASGEEIAYLEGHENSVVQLAWSPDGALLASASNDGRTRLWDTTDWVEVAALGDGSSSMESVAWSPDGALLATGYWSGYVVVWDPGTGEALATLIAHQGPVFNLAWSPDGALLATSSEDGTVRFWGPP
ncbi:MAG: serine/threonine protein kinase [Chloroflexi bacterium]|nr:serine/threonine protein kinase [Chloroflexota bacterium]MCI0576229.1 serine/threonine protein kinase [Chloroflexota bacterium]MCI0645477.1 serine/threonine protein kinase [Chloroflexota bacterium]MCI0730616.1 serine/threonine protein kinase [Chloroflexota bacterium]